MTTSAKVVGVGILLYLAFRGQKAAAAPAPKPTPKPEPTPPKPVCPGPVVGKRWKICGVRPTISEGDFDALYSGTDGRLVAIVNNTTYDDNGDSAMVVATAFNKDEVPVAFPILFNGD